jgi:hypothetical protein
MKIRKSMVGATLLACTLAACDRAPTDSAGTAENSEAPPEKAMITDETTPVGAMKRPETLAERRELRMKLAGQQADKVSALDSVATDDSEAAVGEVPDEMMGKIIDDLLTRIAANRTDIKVLHAESLVWNDGSLGCGQPGQVYTQALVPGYHIILDHEGQSFDYRATEKGYFMLCERPTITRPGAGGDPPTQ